MRCALLKDIYTLTLLKLGGTLLEAKNLKAIDFYKKGLLIKHKPTGIEYTVSKVILDKNKKPVVKCYRYNIPNPNSSGHDQKEYITIPSSEFNKYEPV